MKPPEYYYAEDVRLRAKIVLGYLDRHYGPLPSDLEKAIVIEAGTDWTWLEAAMNTSSLEQFLHAVSFPVPGPRTVTFSPRPPDESAQRG